MFKQVYGTEFDVTKRSVMASGLNEGDEIVTITPIVDQKYVVIRTAFDVFLKFMIDEIPEKRKGAAGVRAIKLTGSDYVESVFFINDGDSATVEVGNRTVYLSRLKTAKRDTKGSKLRG